MPSSSYSFDFSRLRLADAVQIGQALRRTNAAAASQSDAAQRVVELLYDSLRDPSTGEPACALVRCFQTHPYADLPEYAQQAARHLMGPDEPSDNLRCLALLATRGIEPAWNHPETSVGHFAIPLPDTAMVEGAPMIAQLLAQMGLEARHIVKPGEGLLLTTPHPGFNVFHVETAPGSAHIPAQQTFVEPYGIRSVVGMGGLLPSGELFAVILFARVTVSRDVATLFRTLALSVKLAFLPFAPDEVFSSSELSV
jgi:hypothetical protein